METNSAMETISQSRRGFALRAGIGEFDDNASVIGIGFFNICIGEMIYGKSDADATGLGCSYDEVLRRWRERGRSRFSELGAIPARLLAETYLGFQYRYMEPDRHYCGFDRQAFSQRLVQSQVVWAPDGDEAFDDGSHVLQFDVDDQVRIVGFKNVDFEHLDSTIAETTLPADEFYELLRVWIEAFEDCCRRRSPYLNQWMEQKFRFSTLPREGDVI